MALWLWWLPLLAIFGGWGDAPRRGPDDAQD